MEYPAVTVDGIVLKDDTLLLVRRGKDPYKGSYALPGGFVELGEALENAVVREVIEETGIRTKVKGLLGIYSRPDRDPRGHTISFVYILIIDDEDARPHGGDDAAEAGFFPLTSLPKLAFDHDEVVGDLRKGRKPKDR